MMMEMMEVHQPLNLHPHTLFARVTTLGKRVFTRVTLLKLDTLDESVSQRMDGCEGVRVFM
jgi:hypothetical protein